MQQHGRAQVAVAIDKRQVESRRQLHVELYGGALNAHRARRSPEVELRPIERAVAVVDSVVGAARFAQRRTKAADSAAVHVSRVPIDDVGRVDSAIEYSANPSVVYTSSIADRHVAISSFT